jgi:hypothetical protein
MRRDLPTELCRAIDAAVAIEPAARTGLGALRHALEDAADVVDDVPGPIAGGTLDTLALPALTRTRRWREREPRPRRLRPSPAPSRPAHASERSYGAQAPAAEPGASARTGPAPRILAAGAAAGLGAAALAWLGPQPPLQPAAGAAIAAAAVLLLPRIGWLLVAAALLAWLAVPAPGVALLVALAVVPIPPLLIRRGTVWSLPALAPLLGLAGLAGAWPALAGQSSRWQVRAALGALGGWWIALGEVLTSDRLLFGAAREVRPPAAWEDSAVAATQHALWPMLAGGALALAVLWALAAMLLPLLVRGRSAALDLVGVAAWSASLAAATQALSEALVLDPPRGLVPGALAAAVIAVAARAVRGRA